MTRHVMTAVVIWAVLTAAGEACLALDYFPTVGSEEAKDFDEIFRILFAMGIPVLAMVFAVLITGLTNFRAKGTPTADGPAIFGRGVVPVVWVVLTSGLAISTMIYPGLTGLSKLQQGDNTARGWGDQDAPLVVQVEGARWYWTYKFPAAGHGECDPKDESTCIELIGSGPDKHIYLPVDTKIKFDVSALDVIHSLWIPAFRLRIDAVPGHHTFFTTEPTSEGVFESDDAYRVQCSMLCGLDHSGMWNPIHVVSEEEFKTWLASKQKAGK